MARDTKYPAQHLKVIYSNPNMKIDSLRMLPYSIYNAFISIQMPWQSCKLVEVVYHKEGHISFMQDSYRITEQEFKERWSFIKGLKNESSLKFPADLISALRLNKTKREEKMVLKNEVDVKENTISSKHILKLLDESECIPEIIDGKAKNIFISKISKIKNSNKYSFELRKYLTQKKVAKMRPCDIKLSINGYVPFKYKLKRRTKKYRSFKSTGIVKALSKTPYFAVSKLEWTEACVILLDQGRNLLNKVIYDKKLSFMKIDGNFDICYERKITTKERKRSRLGTAFNILRELLKLLKLICDSFVLYRLEKITIYDLCSSLKFLFSNLGTVTGIYRYKYKMNNQIKKCKSFHTGPLVWISEWQVLCQMIRGHIPLLQTYLINLLDRMQNGRKINAKKVTTQRIDSNLDINIKKMIRSSLGPDKRFIKEFNQGWKSWKAAEEYTFSDQRIANFIEIKAEWYINEALKKRCKNKKDIQKQCGKVLRLHLKSEKARQQSFLEFEWPSPKQKQAFYLNTKEYFIKWSTGQKNSSRNSPELKINQNIIDYSDRILKIPFPENDEIVLLEMAISNLMKESGTKEKEFYSKLEKDEIMFEIKSNLLIKRVFMNIKAKIRKNRKYEVYYLSDPRENLTDAFLNVYLWSKAREIQLFPKYFDYSHKSEMNAISKLAEILDSKETVIQFEYQKMFKNINLTLLQMLLKLVIDPILVDYMISRLNCKIEYKDIVVYNSVGVIKGFKFSSFICAFWSFCVDLVAFKFDEIIFKYFDVIILNKPEEETLDSVIQDIETRIPPSLGIIKFKSAHKFPFKMSLDCIDFKITDQFSQGAEKIKSSDSRTLFLKCEINAKAIEIFKSDVKNIIHKSIGSSFIKTVNKWNNLLLDYLNKYKEAADLKSIKECELRILKAIMQGVDSKMPVRFPAVIFYGPRSLGCLGMLTTCNGMSVEELLKNKQGSNQISEKIPNATVLIEDQKNSNSESVKLTDSCYIRSFLNYSSKFKTNFKPVIKNDVFKNYIKEITEIYGGSSNILKGTLYSSLRCENIDSIQDIWNIPEFVNPTRAQKIGSGLLPNKRFILWWSPVLNRSNVFMGYRQRIELTGVIMHGKLNNLKIFYTQIFRNHLWMKIHENAVLAIANAFQGFIIVRNSINKKDFYEHQHIYDLSIKGDFLNFKKAYFDDFKNEIKVKLVVYWGDFDTKESEFQINNSGDSKDVVLTVIDICRNEIYITGRYKDLVETRIRFVLDQFLEKHSVMNILRERIRTSLSLSFKDDALLDIEAYNFGLICELHKNELKILNTKNGILYHHNIKSVLIDEKEKNSQNEFIIYAKDRINKSIRDAACEEIVKIASSLNISNVAVEKDLQKKIEDMEENLLVKKLQTPLGLHFISASENKQFVYFEGENNFTGFYRLKLILNAMKIDYESVKGLGISFDKTWPIWDKRTWIEKENNLKKLCNFKDDNYQGQILNSGKSIFECGDSWREDYIRQNSSKALSDSFKFLEDMDFKIKKNNMNETTVIKIPKNIIYMFKRISMTDHLVKGFIKSFSPFEVVINPQFLGTYIDEPNACGLISNRELETKDKIQIIVKDRIFVRKWTESAYFDLEYEITDECGIFLTCDWNFNFNINSFSLNYSLKEKTSKPFYDTLFMESNIKNFTEKIKELNNK